MASFSSPSRPAPGSSSNGHGHGHGHHQRPPLQSTHSILSATSDGEPFSAEEDDDSQQQSGLRSSAAHINGAGGGASSSATTSIFNASQLARLHNGKLQPLELEMDPTVAWAYRPSSLTALGLAVGAVVLFAYHTENLVIPASVKSKAGLITAVGGFLLVSVVNFRDGPYRRPHPAFWRAILGSNVLYCMTLTYLLWQDDAHGRQLVQYFDPSLTRPADERSYGQNCELTLHNLYNGLDLFAFAHFIGWFGKALILRDFWACTILSVMFEITELSLSHQLPNFQECWWDRWILDVCVCNLGGTIIGLLTCHYLNVTPFSWRGFRKRRFGKMLEPLTPSEWTRFEWKSTKRFRNYLSVVTLLSTFLLSELNVFYLKQLLWLPAEHPMVSIRLAAAFAWALPATAEFYHYITYSRRVKRMGSHAVMLLATVALESLIVLKWSTGKFPQPAPTPVKIFWAVFVSALIIYPIVRFWYYGPETRSGSKSGRATPKDGVATPVPGRSSNGHGPESHLSSFEEERKYR